MRREIKLVLSGIEALEKQVERKLDFERLAFSEIVLLAVTNPVNLGRARPPKYRRLSKAFK